MERAKCAPAPRVSNEMARKPSESVQAGFLEVEWTGELLLSRFCEIVRDLLIKSALAFAAAVRSAPQSPVLCDRPRAVYAASLESAGARLREGSTTIP